MSKPIAIQRTRQAKTDADKRRVHFVINPDADCSELVEFLDSLPRGSESAWWRGIAKQWLASARKGDLNEALLDVLNDASPYAWGSAQSSQDNQLSRLSCSVESSN